LLPSNHNRGKGPQILPFFKGKIALLYYDKYKEISSVGQKWALSPFTWNVKEIN